MGQRQPSNQGKRSHAGNTVVEYRDVDGQNVDALVLAPGSGSGLKLQLVHTKRIIDNVPLRTGLKQTNVYWRP